jgi:hypothetical protein
LEGSEPDIVLTDTGVYVSSAISISDFSDPRINLVLKRYDNGSITPCGWYGIEIPSSLIQGIISEINPNSTDIST